MKYSLNFGLWNSVFAVPSQIVDNHLKMCGAAQLKVLLVLLRKAGNEVALEEIAAFLNLSAGDTQDALNYWVTVGILSYESNDKGATLTAAIPPIQPSAVSPSPPAVNYTVGSAPLQRPSHAEISELVEKNAEFKSLLVEAEASLGKTMKTPDISSLASMYQWAGLPVDVLLTIMEYCKSVGKTNLRYVEKVAASWLDNGIDTFEKAEHHIKECLEADVRERLIKSAFGIYDRTLTSKETEYVKQWLDVYHLDISIIKLAYERSVENTGKMNFPYINKILTSWHSQNISTPEQATKAEDAFTRQKAEQKKPQSSYDIDEFEQYLLHTPPKLS